MENNDYNLNDEPNLPLDDNGKNPFGLPMDYFSKFEDKLKKKIELESELNDFPILSSIKKAKVFTVPDQYFESTENSLEYKTELEAYTKLNAIKKPVFTELEADYKQYLQSAINYKVELIDELKQYHALYALDKINTFSVPDIYFKNVAERIKVNIFTVKVNNVSVLNTILDFVFGKKIAFAFGLVTIISLSIYFYKSPEKPLEIGDCKTLACLERQEILNNTKAISNFDEDQLIDLVDVKSLNKQLNTTKEKVENINTKKLNFDSISDDELLEEL